MTRVLYLCDVWSTCPPLFRYRCCQKSAHGQPGLPYEQPAISSPAPPGLGRPLGSGRECRLSRLPAAEAMRRRLLAGRRQLGGYRREVRRNLRRFESRPQFSPRFRKVFESCPLRFSSWDLARLGVPSPSVLTVPSTARFHLPPLMSILCRVYLHPSAGAVCVSKCPVGQIPWEVCGKRSPVWWVLSHSFPSWTSRYRMWPANAFETQGMTKIRSMWSVRNVIEAPWHGGLRPAGKRGGGD